MGRPSKGERSLAGTRVRDELKHELQLFAALQKKTLSDMLGEVVEEWWKGNPEREKIRELIEEKQAPKKAQEKAA